MGRVDAFDESRSWKEGTSDRSTLGWREIGKRDLP